MFVYRQERTKSTRAEFKAMFSGGSTELQFMCVIMLYHLMDRICRETPGSSHFTVRMLQTVNWFVKNPL